MELAGSEGVVLQPMAQTIDPGGCCKSTLGAVQFQATPHPMAQPWKLPALPRFIRAMALSSLVPSDRAVALSTSRPVAHFMCGWMCDWRPSPSKFRTTLGPWARWVVNIMFLYPPFEAERWTRTWAALTLKSKGAASLK